MTRRATAILTRAAADVNESAPTDRVLLRRFTESDDQAAFAVLVARHAPMVLGVCRRLLPTAEDAEDACQATFLILARKARGVRWEASAANWLYTTARLVAAKTRRAAARRARREGRAAVPEAVAPADTITGGELLAVLDEELGKLPAIYRDPLVLCYLEGLSREEAAGRLGVPQATVKTRLERGRRRLEAALVRRGVGIGLGLLALAVTTPAGASSSKLVEGILAAVSGPPPAAVAALVQGAGMNLRMVLVAVVAAVAAAGLGLGWNALGPAADAAAPAPADRAVIVRPALPPVGLVAIAPAPREGDEKFDKAVAKAREKAIDFLKKQQQPNGSWEGIVVGLLADMEGGQTALATLALLEAGVPANDPAVAKAVDYLAKLPPKKTYVVSLQTQVLARVDGKKHKEQIQKNVDWLLKEAIRKDDKLAGWSYPANQIADMSNTHFAVVALHAAARAGAKVDAKVWPAIRDLYVRTQLQDGRWAYYSQFGDRPTNNMTAAALVGLTIAAKYDKNAKGPYPEFEKGLTVLVPWDLESPKSSLYARLVVAELGREVGERELKAGDKKWAWYRAGAEKLLKEQKEDGSITFQSGIDASPVIATSFGLYFLGPPKK